MMALIFLCIFAVIILAWSRKRQPALYLHIITLILAVSWFGHHLTSRLSLNL